MASGSSGGGKILTSQAICPLFPRPRTQLNITLTWKGQSTELLALIDSGADESLLDSTVVVQLGLTTMCLDQLLGANALDSQLLTWVTTKTAPVDLLLSGNHQEELSFFVKSPHIPVILGHPCLVKHNPQIDWASAKTVDWSSYCHATYLQSALPQSVPSQDPGSEIPDLSLVLPD